MATTIHPITTSSSTISSGAICGTCTRCSGSPCLKSCSPPTSAPATCRCRWSPPVGLLNPILDGRATSYFEWLPAGHRRDRCHRRHHDRQANVGIRNLRTLLFGFDLEHLYLRLDLGGPAAQRLAQGLRCSVNFTTPADCRLVITGGQGGRNRGARIARRADGPGRRSSGTSPRVAAAEILEAPSPLPIWASGPTTPFAFFVTIHDRSFELERHPATQAGRGRRPGARLRRAELESLGAIHVLEDWEIGRLEDYGPIYRPGIPPGYERKPPAEFPQGRFSWLFRLSLIMDVMLTNGQAS